MNPIIRAVVFVGFLAIIYGSMVLAAPADNIFGDTVNIVKNGAVAFCGAIACGDETPFYTWDCCNNFQCCMQLTTLSYVLISIGAIFVIVLAAVCSCCLCCCHVA